MSLTKDDKSLLTTFANGMWGWLKEKVATSTANGMMSKEDKVKLDNINLAGLIPCEIGCQNGDLILYTQEILPLDAKVVMYHYIRRRQKIRPEGATGNTHRRIKGWRMVEQKLFRVTLAPRMQEDDYYGYRYLLSTSTGGLLQTAIRLANIPDRFTRLTSNYFRQRMAIEIQAGADTKPVTRRLEFMMDYSCDEDGLVTDAWFCKVHQRTLKPL